MKFTRILSLLLAILMIAGMLAACDNGEDADTGEGDENVEKLNIITEGHTEYVIVRDYKASDEVKAAINNLLASIKANIGADMKVKECYNDKANVPDDIRTEKEILVGMTNRQESIDTLSGYRSQDYTISMHGSKLVIGSSSDEGTITALTKFLTEFVSEQGNRFAVRQGEMQSLVISKNNEVYETGKYSYDTATMAGVRLDSFGIIYTKGNKDTENFAHELSKHLSKETGHELKVYKDANKQCCYEILIGNTQRTDDKIVRDLGEGEYYIKLITGECDNKEHEGEESHPGAQLIVCWGKNGMSAAMHALTTIMFPVTAESGSTVEIPDGYTLPAA